MTREEELDWLCRLRSEIYVYMPKEWLIPMNNALDMAISALSELGTKANESIKPYVELAHSVSAENKCFDGMTNKEIISEFVERDDSFAIMVDKVNGTVNIELSLDFWNSHYQKGGE